MTQNGLAGCGGASEKRADIGAFRNRLWKRETIFKETESFCITRDEWESADRLGETT